MMEWQAPDADDQPKDLIQDTKPNTVSDTQSFLNSLQANWVRTSAFNADTSVHEAYENLFSDSPKINADTAKQLEKENPGVKIPVGINQDAANVLIKRHKAKLLAQDNLRFNSPSLLGKISAFTGATIGSLAGNPFQAAAGIAAPELAGALAGDTAGLLQEEAMQKVANGYGISDDAIDFLSDEKEGAEKLREKPFSERFKKRSVRGAIGMTGFNIAMLPQTVQEGLKEGDPNIGLHALLSIGEGAIFGGLLDPIAGEAGDALANYFRPITKEADDAAKATAANQMANGKTVNVSAIIKQGKADQAKVLKNVLQENNIPLEDAVQEFEDSKRVNRESLDKTQRQIDILENKQKVQDLSLAEKDKLDVLNGVRDKLQDIDDRHGVMLNYLTKDFEEANQQDLNDLINHNTTSKGNFASRERPDNRMSDDDFEVDQTETPESFKKAQQRMDDDEELSDVQDITDEDVNNLFDQGLEGEKVGLDSEDIESDQLDEDTKIDRVKKLVSKNNELSDELEDLKKIPNKMKAFRNMVKSIMKCEL